MYACTHKYIHKKGLNMVTREKEVQQNVPNVFFMHIWNVIKVSVLQGIVATQEKMMT